MSKPSFLHIPVLALLSFISAFWALGSAYERYTAMIPGQGIFRGIGTDGWIIDGGELQLPYLASRGNYLELHFNDWRPEVPPAHFKVTVCEELAAEFLVEAGTRVSLPLRGDCSPFLVGFDVENTFRASAEDDRELGGQLVDASVDSRLGFAVIDPALGLSASLALLSLALAAWAAFPQPALLGLVYALPIVAAWTLRRADIRDLGPPLWLWAAGICLFVGMSAARRLSLSDPERKAASVRFYSAAALAVTLLGAALRFYGLNFGLPDNYHPDEIPKVNAVMQMVASDSLNPRYFLHPSLLLYCTYFVNTIFHWLWLDGDFRSSAFLAGRTVSALAGSASIFLLFALGSRFFDRRTGLLAAALLAVFPLHVTCSRYLKEDALLLFLMLACLLATLKAVQEGRRGFVLLAGVIAGLSASTKYSGLLSFALVAPAPWLRSRRWLPDVPFLKATIVAGVLMPIAFLGASPYVILDYPKFASDFRYERNHMTRGHTQAIDAWSQYWTYHLSRSIAPGSSIVATLLGLVALGFLLVRRRVEDLLVVALLLIFYLPAEWIKSKPAPQPERYIFPCLPFLALAAAEFVNRLSSTRMRRLVPALILLLVLPPAVRSISLARDLTYDTRVAVRDWMAANVPAGSKVLVDWQPYAPYLSSAGFESEEILRINVLKRLPPAALADSGADYLVLSTLFYDRYFSQPNANRVYQNRFISVFQQVPVVKEFRSPSGTYGFHNPTLTIFSLKPQDFAMLREQQQEKRDGRRSLTMNEERSYFRWPR
jgi:4-amino-4-deoxy-L-arabinose transferase-like glycosyltransferase